MEKIEIGDYLKIIKMEGEPEYDNKEGYITEIDYLGQIHGTWGGCAINVNLDLFEIFKCSSYGHVEYKNDKDCL